MVLGASSCTCMHTKVTESLPSELPAQALQHALQHDHQCDGKRQQ